MMFWSILNTTLTVILAGILIHKLVNWRDSFNCAERFGMSLMAGSVILTIPSLWHAPSPFDYWATSVLRFGAALYFSGRLSRHYRHRRRNDEARDIAAAHLAGRGK